VNSLRRNKVFHLSSSLQVVTGITYLNSGTVLFTNAIINMCEPVDPVPHWWRWIFLYENMVHIWICLI